MDQLINNINKNWHLHWSDGKPFEGHLINEFSDKWVRFHTLPDSKRYPETQAELEIILSRHNTLLSELCESEKILMITTQWSGQPADPKLETNSLDSNATLWRTVFESSDETDPDFFVYRYYYVSEKVWKPKALDSVLEAVADEKAVGVIVAEKNMRWLYMPYDGGADIFCSSTRQRDSLKAKYSDWLSSHPQGL